jgi:hypothetical protein
MLWVAVKSCSILGMKANELDFRGERAKRQAKGRGFS